MAPEGHVEEVFGRRVVEGAQVVVDGAAELERHVPGLAARDALARAALAEARARQARADAVAVERVLGQEAAAGVAPRVHARVGLLDRARPVRRGGPAHEVRRRRVVPARALENVVHALVRDGAGDVVPARPVARRRGRVVDGDRVQTRRVGAGCPDQEECEEGHGSPPGVEGLHAGRREARTMVFFLALDSGSRLLSRAGK